MRMTKWAFIAVAAIGSGVFCGLDAKAAVAGKVSTIENLQYAYDGESNAKVRYEAFAAKADAEGYKSVGALFRAASKSESIHAAKHAAAIKKLGYNPQTTLKAPEVKSTKENLEAALKGETEELTNMYPAFLKQAQEEKNAAAARSFGGALKGEIEHAKLYKLALAELDSWKAPGKEFLVCLVCGYTTMDKDIKKCPVCAAPRGKFEVFK